MRTKTTAKKVAKSRAAHRRSPVGQRIIEGLEQAVAWTRGENNRVQVTLVDLKLARSLADPEEREQVVAAIAASGQSKMPLLLSWTENPPPGLNGWQLYQLNIGLADAFGELKVKEAIPFLIRNINLSRTNKANTWMKTPAVIQRELPAAAALIRIGPEAGKAVMRAAHGPLESEDRRAMVFVVSRMIQDFPEAAGFLAESAGYANSEAYWASEGLKALGIRTACPCTQ